MKKLVISLFFLMVYPFSFAQHIKTKPEIMGGLYNYKMILDQEMYYPQAAIEANAEGEIIVGFIVGTNGMGKNYEVIQSVHPELDEAYINVLKHLLWNPGKEDGIVKDFRTQYSEKFKIKKYQKLVKRRAYNKPEYPYNPHGNLYKIASSKRLEHKAKPYYKKQEVNIYKFIQEYIKIPDAAVKQGIKGEVEIVFIVEASGRLSNFKELKGIGGGCTEEAYRLIQMLHWEPAKMNGEYVRSEYQIQVNFGNTRY